MSGLKSALTAALSGSPAKPAKDEEERKLDPHAFPCISEEQPMSAEQAAEGLATLDIKRSSLPSMAPTMSRSLEGGRSGVRGGRSCCCAVLGCGGPRAKLGFAVWRAGAVPDRGMQTLDAIRRACQSVGSWTGRRPEAGPAAAAVMPIPTAGSDPPRRWTTISTPSTPGAGGRCCPPPW